MVELLIVVAVVVLLVASIQERGAFTRIETHVIRRDHESGKDDDRE